ncbi:MAG: 2-oxo acid dehydrogenase subunit E2, partial [Actinomycetota bacterium]
MTPENKFGGSFGANEWLVDEMYEQYLRDPNSITAEWKEFFAGYKPVSANGGQVNGASSGGALPSAPVTAPGTPPIPKRDLKAEESSKPTNPVQPTAPVQTSTPAQPVTPVATPAPTQTSAPSQQPPSQPQQVMQQVVRPAQSPAPTPAQPVAKPLQEISSPSAARIEPLRGVANRVVQSMEASLSVPTATSVRAIPAKLMIDNRTVINNHLKRARGGKVSFTHIIGYAMIRALRESPEMNAFFTELDGKPAIGFPDHINLGIAIDLAKEDGSRQLLVPSIKGCEGMDFGQFWSTYESLVKKARKGALAIEDFAGTTCSLTNPGTIGTVHSVPRLVQGQGLILGVGAMDYPAEFQGASEETIARLAISKVVT